MNSERWRVPGPLAGKNARVDDERVRNVVGATIGGYDRGARVRPHATRAPDVGSCNTHSTTTTERSKFEKPPRLVAPTGFDHDASALELEFEGLALAA